MAAIAQRLRSHIGLDVATAPIVGEKYAEIDGRKLFYQEAGSPDRPAMLFLHGAGTHPSENTAVMHALAEQGFYVVAPEHPGMGRSEHLPNYDEGFVRSYALAYDKFLKKKGLREPIVVAQSFGGLPANGLAILSLEKLADEERRPKALVLVDAFIAQPPKEVGFRHFYGFLLRHLSLPLRLPWRNLRRYLAEFFTGTPPEYYRDDVEGDIRFARELGTLFIDSTKENPPLEIDYPCFILDGDKERPLIFVWGEKDGTRVLEYGEWGAKTTAVHDALALYQRILGEVADQLSASGMAREAARDRANDLVRMTVIPNAGHTGLYTHSYMGEYVDTILEHLREARVLDS